MKRGVTGVQTHHSVQLDDAVRGLTNAGAGLRGAFRLTDDQDLALLLGRLDVLTRDVSQAQQRARRRLQELYLEDPQTFRAAREGESPWPDEVAEGFVPRCSCDDQCLVHDQGLADSEWGQRYPDAVAEQCNCDYVCSQHEEDDE